LTESCWLYTVAIALAMLTGSGSPPPWPLWFVFSLANLGANLLPEPEGGDRALLATRLLAAASAIAVLGLLPPRPEFLALTVYLVWHGRRIAELDVPEGRYRATVFAGALGVLAALLVRAFLPTRPAALATAQALAVAAFAGAALFSLIVAQRRQLMEEEDLAPSGAGIWIIAATAVGAAVGGTALLVLLVPPLAQGGLVVLALLGHLLLLGLFYLLLPVVSLLFALIYGPLAGLLRGLHLPPPHPPEQPTTAFEQMLRQQTAFNAALDRWLHLAEWLAVALIVLAVLLLVSSGIRRRVDPSRRRSDQRTSVWRWNLLADWLAQLGKRAGGAAAAAGALLPRPNAGGGPRSVREMYVELQRMTARLGYGRRPEQTALEHCALVAERLPDIAPALRRLAVGYGDERYGGVPATETLPMLLPDWQQIIDACRVGEPNGT
jgi:hypothetical protein